MTGSRPAAAVAAALALAAGAAHADAPKTPAPIVFFDIAGPDLASQADFYKAVFGWSVDGAGRTSVPATSPLPGLLRVEDPSQGPVADRVLYLGVANIDSTLTQITAHGGSMVFPRTVVPGVVILALFKDPAGNRMGLVELGSDGKPVVPGGK